MRKNSGAAFALLAAATTAPTACRTPSHTNGAAEVKVTNGIEGAPTPDIRLIGVGGLGICTGTFVNSTTLITAAHCVTPSIPGGGIEVESGKSLNYFINPKYFSLYKQETAAAAPQGISGVPAAPGAVAASAFAQALLAGQAGDNSDNEQHFQYYDLAIVVFAPNTAQQLGITNFRAVRAQPGQTGESIFVVGYGDNDWTTQSGGGMFRWGTNKIDEAGTHYLVTKGVLKANGTPNGANANAGHGDSGGPLVAQNQDILGTVSTGGPLGNQAVAIYVNLTSDYSRQLFQKAVFCGFPPCAQNFAGSGVTGQGNGGNNGQLFNGNGFDGRQPDVAQNGGGGGSEAGAGCLSDEEAVALLLVELAVQGGEQLSPQDQQELQQLEQRFAQFGSCNPTAGAGGLSGSKCVARAEVAAGLAGAKTLEKRAAQARREDLRGRKAAYGVCK